MTTKKTRSLDPVAFPHDGPLLSIKEDKNFNDECSSTSNRSGLREANNLLQNWSSMEVVDNGSKGELIKYHSIKFIGQLHDATTLRDQMKFLREYRSNILQIQKTKEMLPSDEIASANTNTNTNNADSVSNVVIGMYRIIFELCLSCKTPLPFKKASYSCIAALALYLEKSSTTLDDAHYIHLSLLASLSSKMWAKPVQTLFEILSHPSTQALVLQSHKHTVSAFKLFLSEGSALNQTLNSTCHNNITDDKNNDTMMGVVGSNVLEAVEKSFEICSTLKVMLTPLLAKQQKYCFSNEEKQELLGLCVSAIDQLLKPLLCCRASSVDALTVCGVCYGQILLFKWRLGTKDETVIAKDANTFIMDFVGNLEEIDDQMASTINVNTLPNLLIVKGLASTLTDSILIQSVDSKNNALLIHPIASYMMRMSQASSNDAIRLLALKGLETIMGRCKTIITSSSTYAFVSQTRELANDVLQLSLVTFDNPPCKQIGSAVPGLFKSLVDLMEVLDQNKDEGNIKMESMDILVSRVLAQPSSRKGKYIALDSLLFKVGASKLMKLAKSQESESLVSSFVKEIGDRGNSAGAVAELLGKILSLLRDEMHQEAGIDLHRAEESKKERRKKERKVREQGAENLDDMKKDVVRLLPQWMSVWVPSFASAILCSKASRRSHISSYCLPLISTMVGGSIRKMDACHCFAALLNEIDRRDEVMDRKVWAKLEVIRHASLHKLLKSSVGSKILQNSVASVVSIDMLKSALIHESSSIRSVAFQTISAIVPTTSENLSKDPIQCIQLEVKLWKESLPYAFNCPEKEHMIVLNNALQTFLQRISDIEATYESKEKTSILTNFVNDILVNDLFLKQAYPGTISEKESFALKMLDSIYMFSSRTRLDKKLTPKSKAIQEDWNSGIVAALLSDNVFATLLSLLYSMWDATRASAYSSICQLIELARQEGLPLPSFFTSKESYNLLRTRATHLASSPRQREADTGAKILAILCVVLTTHEEQEKYLKDLYHYLKERLELMSKSLGVVLNPEIEDKKIDKKGMLPNANDELPLAHGLIHALRLIINEVKTSKMIGSREIFIDLANICCRAIEVSLVVVADINDGANDQHVEQENSPVMKQRWKLARIKKSGSTPLNVNTGALGANATFASCKPINEEEFTKRLAMQRILVGSWLLTKEACATLSSVITDFPGKSDFNIISTAGDLLISTLTTLKHQGAAFAAHKSLQKICARCYTEGDENGIRLLPSKWSHRLIFEISSPELVRDSTLRRSTGYGLGTLSILRTEECSGPRFLFPSILSSIIRLSLPSFSVMKECAVRWNFSSLREMFVFAHNQTKTKIDFVKDEDYVWRTRIHALNILRLVILDAPLAVDMRKFVGDSIISALTGYSDATWDVRNSATMTFAAAMLRVVDPDKNAGGKGKEIEAEVRTSAITATELFRSYPPLVSVLIALMKEETDSNVSKSTLHPTLFPLLLLLSRLQPISMSRIDPNAENISNMFIDPVTHCLGHVQQKIRIVAARALAVLCSGDDEKRNRKNSSSRCILIERCVKLLSNPTHGTPEVNHNQDHGTLLALKYLLVGCPKPYLYFNESLMDAIGYFGSWGYFKGTCPPSCVIVALEIWHYIDKSMNNDSDLSSVIRTPHGESMLLRDTLYKIVRCVEVISRSGNIVIGLAALGSNAAKIAIEASHPIIFNTFDPSSYSVELGMVEKLICSESYDVMLHSVKSFKKKICQSVDTLIEDTSVTIHHRIEVLGCVCQMLICSLFNVMNRDGTSTHPSTMRRISRCILEAVSGYKILSGKIALDEISKFSSPQMFRQFATMLALDSEANPRGSNVGNALELMALTMSDLCITKHDTYTEQSFQHDLSLFVNSICKSTDPESSWKLRYSVATSVKESGLLLLNIDDSNSFHPIIEHCKMRLYFQMVQLLQDGDEDVRKVAARALLPSSNTLTTSLRNLEIGYEKELSKCTQTDELFTMLAKQVIGQCQNIETNLKEIINEFHSTVGITDLTQVQNVSAERKIFEEEDRNTFEESLLILHLSIQKLTQISSMSKHYGERNKEMFENLISTCSRVLEQIKDITRRSGQTTDIAHNLSWVGKVFPGIHGVLLGSIFSIYHFGIEGNNIVEEVNNIMIESTLIHPCISEALNALSLAKYNDTTTGTNLLKCCFLVPSSKQ